MKNFIAPKSVLYQSNCTCIAANSTRTQKSIYELDYPTKLKKCVEVKFKNLIAPESVLRMISKNQSYYLCIAVDPSRI